MRVQHPGIDKYGTRSGSDGVCASQELNIQGSTKLPIDTRLMSLEPGRYRDCVKTLRQFWRWVFDATRRRSGQWLLWTFHTVAIAPGSVFADPRCEFIGGKTGAGCLRRKVCATAGKLIEIPALTRAQDPT